MLLCGGLLALNIPHRTKAFSTMAAWWGQGCRLPLSRCWYYYLEDNSKRKFGEKQKKIFSSNLYGFSLKHLKNTGFLSLPELMFHAEVEEFPQLDKGLNVQS